MNPVDVGPSGAQYPDIGEINDSVVQARRYTCPFSLRDLTNLLEWRVRIFGGEIEHLLHDPRDRFAMPVRHRKQAEIIAFAQERIGRGHAIDQSIDHLQRFIIAAGSGKRADHGCAWIGAEESVAGDGFEGRLHLPKRSFGPFSLPGATSRGAGGCDDRHHGESDQRDRQL